MKLSLSFPSDPNLLSFLQEQSSKDFTYPKVGATQSTAPKHFDEDHNFIELGHGEQLWQGAKSLLNTWQHFPQPWTKVVDPNERIKEGQTVAVLFRIFGIWFSNSARIVYIIDEPNRYGFAYGTLPGHIEMGEELFLLERDDRGGISYHIKAFSRPAHWLVRLGYPIARFFQARFVRASLAAMKQLANE